MISLELSSIQHNSAESARLAAAMAEFERSGGRVRNLGSFSIAAKPLRKEPLARKPRYNGADHRAYTDELEDLRLLDRIKSMRDLGVSHYQAEKRTGISRTTIRRIVEKYGISYPSSSRATPEQRV